MAELVEVRAELPLVERRLAVRMHELDRILERDDVHGPRRVDLAEQRRERGRLARAGRAGDQDHPGFLVGHLAERVRQLQILERGDLRLQLAQHHRQVAALLEDVDAEPRTVAERVGAVARALGHQVLAQSAIAIDQVQGEDLGLKRRQALDGRIGRHADELAGRLDLQRPIHRHVHVRDVVVRVEHRRQQVVDLGFSHARTPARRRLTTVRPEPS